MVDPVRLSLNESGYILKGNHEVWYLYVHDYNIEDPLYNLFTYNRAKAIVITVFDKAIRG
jgi:hypothetical protein